MLEYDTIIFVDSMLNEIKIWPFLSLQYEY